jgi:hypothetical protein
LAETLYILASTRSNTCKRLELKAAGKDEHNSNVVAVDTWMVACDSHSHFICSKEHWNDEIRDHGNPL